MKIGSLDTDSKALQSRIDLQNEYSSFDLNTWIFDCLDINDEHACLDLGCGTGNQILKITSNPNFSGHITGMDVSEDSLASLMFSAKDQGVADKVTTIKSELDVSEEDIAKRLIDYGFHAPTMSFPVPGTLMIEPTESESKEEIDRFCSAMISIHNEVQKIREGKFDKVDNPLKNAPHTIEELTNDKWDHLYSRQEAAYPHPYLLNNKYWAPVARIDNVYGDRNLFCICPPIEQYEDKIEKTA